MKLSPTIRLIAGLSLGAILIALAFAVIPSQAGQASGRMINLTIDNRAGSSLTLVLRGTATYVLDVAGDETQVFKVLTGEYTYNLRGCGMRVTGSLKLTNNTIMINPVCGGSVPTVPKDPSKINLGAKIKVVPVKLINDLDYPAKVILTGPSTYVFTLQPDQVLNVTIGKGNYNVNYFACTSYVNRGFQAYKNAKYTMRCP